MTSSQKIELALRASKLAKTFLELMDVQHSHVARVWFVAGIKDLMALDEFIAKCEQEETKK